MTQAEAVYTALCAVITESLSGTVYQRCVPLQEPFALEIDANERVIVACNYEVTL
jgi:hypothetical protein